MEPIKKKTLKIFCEIKFVLLKYSSYKLNYLSIEFSTNNLHE